jgi:hypothetical protein
MDAFVRNKCEAELLAILQEVCAIIGSSIKVETIPSEEGGLREYWKILGDNESPRVLRRLHTLRRWSHEQEIKPFFT